MVPPSWKRTKYFALTATNPRKRFMRLLPFMARSWGGFQSAGRFAASLKLRKLNEKRNEGYR
jgi:hypothetical protein